MECLIYYTRLVYLKDWGCSVVEYVPTKNYVFHHQHHQYFFSLFGNILLMYTLHKGKSIKYINTLWKDSETERKINYLRTNIGKLQSVEREIVGKKKQMSKWN